MCIFVVSALLSAFSCLNMANPLHEWSVLSCVLCQHCEYIKKANSFCPYRVHGYIAAKLGCSNQYS